MKKTHLVGLVALAALMAGAFAFAEDQAKPAAAPQDQAAAPQKPAKGKKMCADCESFHKQMKADQETFQASLKDKTPAERKAAKAEFKKQQADKKAEFKKNHKCVCKGGAPAAKEKTKEPAKPAK
ncbi:MAG: hypothetical protein PHU21_00835 [Elusimicrobia bacterium]|jgi:polyhydroxyalkanoate synthesis regulator protein|nr:hypothetical protein [Elusimicrobiota bacterium]